MLSRSESHYFWIWWLSTLRKKRSAFLIFPTAKPNGNTHVTFVVFYFKAAVKFTLEIFTITSTVLSFFFSPKLCTTNFLYTVLYFW